MQDQYDAEEAYWEAEEAGLLPGEDMDGDFDSAMASAGHGMDEDYGFAEDMHCEGYDEY